MKLKESWLYKRSSIQRQAIKERLPPWALMFNKEYFWPGIIKKKYEQRVLVIAALQGFEKRVDMEHDGETNWYKPGVVINDISWAFVQCPKCIIIDKRFFEIED